MSQETRSWHLLTDEQLEQVSGGIALDCRIPPGSGTGEGIGIHLHVLEPDDPFSFWLD